MTTRACVFAAIGLLAAAGTSGAQEPSKVWHYWSGGSEHQAIEALIKMNNAAYPQTPVEGEVIPGVAIEMRRQLQTALLGGTPPAAYQSSFGYELKTFVDAKQLQSVDKIWNEVKGEEIFPDGLKRVLKVDGKPYAMPLNMHLINNVFYNKKFFAEHGIAVPKTNEEFQKACQKIEATGIACIANAGGPFWTFYNYYPSLISTVGVEGYYKLAKGEMSFRDPAFRKSMELFRDTYVKHYMANWTSKTWSQAAEDVVAGRAAAFQMGDWTSAYFKDLKWTPGVDYDFFSAPGAGDAVIFQADVIAVPAGTTTSLAAADNFLRTVADPKGQAAFNKLKGSVAANLNTPTDIYDFIGKKTYAELQAANKAGKVLPNLFFLLPTELGSEFGVQIERFAGDPSDATLDSIIDTLEPLREQAKADKLFVSW